MRTYIESVLEEFDKEFPLGGETWVLKRHKEEVESFFKQKLQEALAQQKEDLIKKLEGEKKDERWNKSDFYKEHKNVFFNEVIDRAIEIIKEQE